MSLNIVVCVKQVPVSNNLKIDPITKNVIRTDEIGVMNPFDKNAVEEALRLKALYGGIVTILSMGPINFELTLREGLAMGADQAILLSDRKFGGADTLATGYVLSEAIKKIGKVDLVFLGRQSIDADTGQVGPIVAEFLNWPQVTYVSELKPLNENKIEAVRLMENLEQVVEVTLPAVITVRSELNNPRYPSPRTIMLSYDNDIKVWDQTFLKTDENRIGIKGSPTVVRDIWTPEKVAIDSESLGLTAKDAALKLALTLKNKNII